MRLPVAIVVALTLTLLGSACNLPNPEDYKNTDKPTEPPPPPPPPPNDKVKGFAISTVEPSTGSLKGQELVEIHGGGFQEGAVAYFGASRALDTLLNSESRIFATTPPHHGSYVDVRVVNPDNTEAVLKDGFRFAADIDISAIVPLSGSVNGGTPIEIHGSGFWGTETVLVGGRMALKVTVVADHTILAVLPPGVAGPADVHVLSNGNSGRLADAFNYIDDNNSATDSGLNIELLSPTQGPSSGGIPFSINGSGFAGEHVDVFLGALPAAKIKVLHDGLIQAVVPEGSPGLADLRVIVDGHQVRLKDAFNYLAGKVQLFAISPAQGAIAGNTWVTLYGTDLPLEPELLFGEKGAKWAERLSPTTIVAKSPRSEDIGTVDVSLINSGELPKSLIQSYTYFDPTARWGGTWGGPIKGSINVTVLDTYTNEPIEEAIVIVGPEHPPTLLGYTDSRGQITLSRQNLAGRQIVTAAKPDYSASTIVDMDAKNVTFFLTGEAPSNGGGGGGEVNPLVPGNIDGIVHINSKYMNLPPAQCDAMGVQESGHCTPCQADSECLASAPHCVTLTDQNPFCTTECLVAADCPQDFECQKSATESVNRCVPTRGVAQVRCYLSNTSLFSSAPSANEDNTVEISTGETAFALKNVRLGDVAVYCVGGSRREIAGIASFTGYVMGIQRHIFVTPGKDMTKKDTPSLPPMQVNISLDIPLTRAVETVVGERPLHPDGPHRTEIKAWLMLGSDGIIPLEHRDLDNGEHDYRFTGLPLSLTEELYDAEYAFYAGALSNTSELTPTSEVLRMKLPALDSAPYLVKEGNVFAVKESGYPGDVLDLHVLDSDSVMAVTHNGSVIHFNGLSWFAQPVQRGPTLRGIDRDLAGGIVAVGDQGRILRWNKVGWSTDLSGTQNNLRDVVSTSSTSAVAVGKYVILSWAEGNWSPVSFGPPKDLHALWGLPGSDLFAVGEAGIVVRRDAESSNWASVNVPIHSTLRGVFGTASGLVMAVGDRGGCIAKEGNGEFALIETPTEHNLRDLWGRSNTDIYAVGDSATVLHYDGNAWEKLTEGTIESSLRAIHGTGSTADLLLTMGTQSIHLGPFLGISRFESPAFGEIWDGHSFKWTVDPAGGVEPSFQAFRLYNASNRLFWSIIAPEWVNSFKLPDLAATAGIPLPKAIKRLTGTKVLHSGFKIDEFDIRIYRLSDWRAWSLFGFLFDNPSSVPK